MILTSDAVIFNKVVLRRETESKSSSLKFIWTLKLRTHHLTHSLSSLVWEVTDTLLSNLQYSENKDLNPQLTPQGEKKNSTLSSINPALFKQPQKLIWEKQSRDQSWDLAAFRIQSQHITFNRMKEPTQSDKDVTSSKRLKITPQNKCRVLISLQVIQFSRKVIIISMPLQTSLAIWNLTYTSTMQFP